MVRDQWVNFNPYSFSNGIFIDHRESGPRFIVSSEGRCFLQYSVPVTVLD